MNVDEMISTLNMYLKKFKITNAPITSEGVGNSRKGVMKIPVDTFDVHPFAYELHLVGYVPGSSQDEVPYYARYDDSNPSKVRLVAETGDVIKFVNVENGLDMLNKLVTLIPPKVASGTQDQAAAGGNVEKMLAEILRLVTEIHGRV
jgi:hypothetical protein